MSDNLDDSSYYFRYISMVIDLGTEVVRLLFYSFTPREDVKSLFSQPKIKERINFLKRQKILRKNQLDLVLSSDPDPDHFDLNLLITLLCNLFEDKIQQPVKGWHTFSPKSDDLSISADLWRLRGIRNEIISHHVRAKLPKPIFDDLWKEAESSLIRITSFVDPMKVSSMKNKISEYATRPLDRTDALQNAIYTVNIWYDEVHELQTQVEKMANRSKALYNRLQDVEKDHRRYCKLLIHGGRIVLIGIWQREKHKRGEQKLMEMLDKERTFLEKQLCINFREDIDVYRLDISDLGALILRLFKCLDDSEISTIDKLLCLRKNYTEIAFMSNSSFMNSWTKLVMFLTSLAAKQTSEVQDDLTDKVLEISEDDNFADTDEYIKELTESGRELKSLSCEYQENIDRLKESLRQMREEGIPFGEEKDLTTK